MLPAETREQLRKPNTHKPGVDKPFTVTRIIEGSRLNGLADEFSDYDRVKIFIPSFNDLITNRIMDEYRPNTLDSLHAGDNRSITLKHFINQCLDSRFSALDLLRAGKGQTLERTDLWSILCKRRKEFYSKRMISFADYITRCRVRYSYAEIQYRLMLYKELYDVVVALRMEGKTLIKDVWEARDWPESSFLMLITDHTGNKVSNHSFLIVEGAKYDVTSNLKLLLTNLSVRMDELEKKQASGDPIVIDWKEITRALRYGFQFLAVLENGDYSYPLKENDYLKLVRQGEIDFEEVCVVMEELSKQIRSKGYASDLPDKPNDTNWRKWLVTEYAKAYNFK